jgi:hypothetical protein
MTVSDSSGSRRFRWPAEYYSAPAPRQLLPSWATFGCGAAAAIVLVVIFAGGALLTGERFIRLMDFSIGMSLGEMRSQFAGDVTEARKKSLEAEIERMRTNLREQKVPFPSLQPFLEGLQAATSDRKVTAEEAERLEQTARKINRAARR